MPEDIFRVVVTVAVLLACIAFMVQAVVAVAFYKSVRKIQQKVEGLSDKVEPLMAKIEPVIEKVGPMIDKAVPVVERLGPMMDGATQTLERMRPVIDRTVQVIGKIGVVVEQAGPAVDSARQVLASANQVIVDARPRISEFTDEAVAVAHSGREQVERIGELLHDVGDRARARLEQIDESVGNTVGQVGQVGDAMKRAVLRPVREANGLAAGISAAVSTLVHPRKASPGSATQDEEMFI
jgi:ABC-type transporter Mla subunit MlaD